MNIEKTKENGCKIFTILFKNTDPHYEFGDFKGKAEEILQKIAELGETKQYFSAGTIIDLSKIFKKINYAIKNEFGLLLKKA